MTTSLKTTSTAITSPTLYEPSAVEEVTLDTVGSVVSIIIFLFAPRELVAHGVGNIKEAADVPPVSVIVPLFKARDVVAT